MTTPHSYAEIISTFGDPHFDGNTVDPKWESTNMEMARDLPFAPKLYVHRLIHAPLRDALNACVALNDGYQVRRLGCFAPRAQRGSSGAVISTHTWGIAIDLNPDTNKLITSIELDDPRRKDPVYHDIPDAWVAAFAAAGFFWGGRFKHRFDAMHFQFCTGY